MSIEHINIFRRRFLYGFFYRAFYRKTCAERFEPILRGDRWIDGIDGIPVERVREEAAWYQRPRSVFFRLCTWIASWFTGIRQRFALLVLYDAQCLQAEIAKGTKGQDLSPFYAPLEEHQQHPLLHTYEGVQDLVAISCQEARPLLSQALILNGIYQELLDEPSIGSVHQRGVIQRGDDAYHALLLKQRWEEVDEPEFRNLKQAISRVKYLDDAEKSDAVKDLGGRLKQYIRDISKTYHPDKLEQQRGFQRTRFIPTKEIYQAFPCSQYFRVKDEGLYYYDKIWSNALEPIELDADALIKIDALFLHEDSVSALPIGRVQAINTLIGKECSPAYLVFRDIYASFEPLLQEIDDALKIEKPGRSYEEILAEREEILADIRKILKRSEERFEYWMRDLAIHREETRIQLAEQAARHRVEQEALARRLEEQAAATVQLAEQAVKFELSLGEIRAQLLEHQRNPIEAEPIAASAAGNNQMLGQGARFKMFSPANDATMGYSMVFLKLAALPKLNRAVLEGIFQGKDGMLLVEDRLYSLKQSERCLEEIPVTEENRVAMVQVKSLFADERPVLISKSTDLILVISLLGDSMSLASANRS